MSRIFNILLVLILALIWQPIIASPTASSAPEEETDIRLLNLIGERLSLMKSVAAYKWINQLPIEDLPREQVVIENAVQTGLKKGITVQSSKDFFGAQIAAAKSIQGCWFNRWQLGDAPVSSPDLNLQTRPRLIELGSQISARLQPTAPVSAQFNRIVSVDCLSDFARNKLSHSLGHIAFYPNRLSQVLDSHALRVGTTGDYAPFSLTDHKKKFSGVDIELAHDLADSLGVELLLVPTSWPKLMQDLAEGHFDIAMSGVSRTVERAQTGYFSRAYHVGGKTPIALCKNAKMLASLIAIDQPSVRITVNPGGTNEKFLDANIRQAKKVLHGDNRTIFKTIIDGQADVMITDSIEVELQTAIHPELCATMPGEYLTYQEKGYLMPQDANLAQVVDIWLTQKINDGSIAKIFQRHLKGSLPES